MKSLAPRGSPKPVYNIEVNCDHNYRVADAAVLVHNAFPCRNKHRDKPKGPWRKKDGRFGLKPGPKVKNSLHRPTLRADTKRQIRNAADKNAKRQFIDKDGNVIKEWHYGHKRGWENCRLIAAGNKLGMTQKQFNDYVNARAKHFQIEDAKTNLSHAKELAGNGQLERIMADMKSFLRDSGSQ